MSVLLRRRRRFLGASIASLALLGVAAGPASAADRKLELTSVYAGPVAPTTEIRDTDPNATDRYPGGRCGFTTLNSGVISGVNSIAAKAGTSTDECIAFFLPEPDVGSDTTADSPDLSVATGDDAKNIEIDLPRGFQAAPKGAPTCTAGEFRVNPDGTTPAPVSPVVVADIANACPTGSLVGRTRASVYTSDAARIGSDNVNGGVYNLVPGPGEIARLGVEVRVSTLVLPTRAVVRFLVTGGDDSRLRAVVTGLPRQTYPFAGGANNGVRPLGNPINILIHGIGILVWGKQSDHPELGVPAFAQHGTECGRDLSATASVTTYNGTTSTKTSAPYQVTDCGALPFAPSVSLSDVAREPGVPTPVTVNVDVPQAANQPLTSLVKDVSVTLPAGLEVGAQVASGESGLPLCSADAFAASNRSPAGCPAGSKVGEAQIETPLVSSPFKGNVYLGPQPAVGELPKLYLEATLDGATGADAVRIKLVGAASVDDTGKVTATFAGNPQLRFNRIQLKFRGGANALFISPRTCGTTTGSSSISPSSGGATVTAPLSLTVDQNCAIPAFAPTVGVTPSSSQAGATAPSTITIDRPDRSAWLKDVKVSLPAGLLAFLKTAPECSTAAAAAGTCSASSRIGTVRVKAGAGASPLSLTGALYIVEPTAGAVAGAAIVVRAKIGDLDLGDVVVPGRIDLRRTDAGLDFVTTAPTRVHNLALNMRTIEVALDRDGFATNPSACGPLPFGSSITGDGGETATPGGTVSYTGCAQRAFQPGLRATLTGDIKPGGLPGMFVEITPRPGDTNMRATTVLLPDGVAAAARNIQVQCLPAEFVESRCPEATRVGKATVNVSITDDVITGDIYLIKVAGEQLPGLGLNITGRYAQRVTSVVRVNSAGRLAVVFDAIPDLPITRLVVDVAGGAKGPLQLSGGDCAIGTRWDATFSGQGGQTATAQTGLRCAARSSMRLSAKTGFSLRNFDFGGRYLKTATVTIPKGYKLVASAAKPKGRAWARADGGKAKLKVTSKGMTVTTTATKLTSLRIKLSAKAVRRTSKKKLKKGATVSIPVRFTYTDGAVQTQTIKAKAG